MAEVRLTIWGIDKASATFRKIQHVGGGAFDKIKSAAGSLKSTLFSLKGAIAAVGIAFTAKLFTDVASSFEDMEVKLNALTKGRGRQTLEEINQWALKMPVNTRKAVNTFIKMQAMGLDPTIGKMQILTDVASIFGEDAMPRVARALGQMANLGHLSAEELNQLAEAGINARKYLRDAFGGKSVEELQRDGTAIQDIINAIWTGLQKDFQGVSEQAMKTWKGLKTTLISYFEEIARKIMDSGPFKLLKDSARTLVQYIDQNWDRVMEKSKMIGNAIVDLSIATVTAISDIGVTLSLVVSKASDWFGNLMAGWRWIKIEYMTRKLQELAESLAESEKKGDIPTDILERRRQVYENTLNALKALIQEQNAWRRSPSNYDKVKSAITTIKNELTKLKKMFKDFRDEQERSKIDIKISGANAEAEAKRLKARLDQILPPVMKRTLIIEARTRSSPERPFTEGIQYMQDKLDSLNKQTQYVLDLSGLSELITSLSALVPMYSAIGQQAYVTNYRNKEQRQILSTLSAIFRRVENIMKSNGSMTFNINGGDSQSIINGIENILSNRLKYGRSALA
jgi:tape measure domain-containing protein